MTMILTLLAALAAPLTAPPHAAAVTPAAQPPLVQDDEYATRLEAAGEDPTKLWELAAWCKENGRNSDRRKVLKLLVKVDPEHKDARKALGHHFHDGRWFSSRTELSAYRRKEEQRKLEEEGLVRLGDEWVPKEEAPYRRMGWILDEQTGRYMSPARIARRAEEEQLRAGGYTLQDLTWIAPTEADKIAQGMWKCGDDWKTIEEANAYHADLKTPWVMPSQQGRFVVRSTCSRVDTEWAAWWADAAYADLVKIFGKQPPEAPTLLVANSLAQYNALAAGDQAAAIPAVEGQNGWSAAHYSFFADMYFDPSVEPPEFRGAGVAYYVVDDPALKGFGPLAIRHAAGQAFIDAIDPSWGAISQMVQSASSGGQPGGGSFWSEKKIPLWLRYGAAAYVERFYWDSSADKGAEWRMRDWSLANLSSRGGLRPAAEVLAFNLNANTAGDSNKLILEAGTLVSFIMDGNCGPVSEAHAAFKSAFRAGGEGKVQLEALVAAISENEAELRKYAGAE